MSNIILVSYLSLCPLVTYLKYLFLGQMLKVIFWNLTFLPSYCPHMYLFQFTKTDSQTPYISIFGVMIHSLVPFPYHDPINSLFISFVLILYQSNSLPSVLSTLLKCSWKKLAIIHIIKTLVIDSKYSWFWTKVQAIFYASCISFSFSSYIEGILILKWWVTWMFLRNLGVRE